MHFSSFITGAFFASLTVAVPAPGKGAHGSAQCPHITPKYAKTVVSQFTTDGIVPDLIEATTLGTPKVEVDVVYGTKQVNLGTYFTTAQTLTAPTVTFTAEKWQNPYTTKYVYFLVDPDVPENGSPAQVNFLHWMVIDAQPSCVTTQIPETIVIYEPLTPASTTQHRYTFLVYRQPPGYQVTTAEDILLQVRSPFDLNDYAQDNNLVLVGGNFLKEAIDNGLQG